MEPITDYTVEDTSKCALQATSEGADAFVNARFGMSVHWGLYALEGRGEWVMHVESIPLAEYRKRMQRFNPVRFNAEEWADLMLEAGQKFLFITSKHHDGFCMFDSAHTQFKVTNSAFGRDPIAELAEALHERGIGLHLYYSLLDWTHPAYRSDWPAYVAYYQAQLRELLTNYGRIDGILFDGYWPRFKFTGGDTYFAPGGPWDLAGTYDLIHTLQPHAVVVNNHHVLPLKGEDYQVWELDMPGENTIGFNTTDIGDRPRAVWWNLNVGWAYYQAKCEVKQPEALTRHFMKALSRDATFVLNVGPTDLGEILPGEQDVLRRIGQWLKVNGAAVYGARPLDVAVKGGFVTRAGGRTHVVVTDWPGGEMSLSGLGKKFKSARVLGRAGAPVKKSAAGVGLTVGPVKDTDLPAVIALS